MKTRIELNSKTWLCDLSNGYAISIPLRKGGKMRAFNAPEIKFEPVVAGSFIGSLEAGSPVNFYNISINPHGSATHTESCLHIHEGGLPLNQCLKESHHVAKLISVEPQLTEDGDRIVSLSCLNEKQRKLDDVSALIIRTHPNSEGKREQDYSGTNPCYIDEDLAEWLSGKIDHLLIDLPSVDREEDGGLLKAHNAFWNTGGDIHLHKTITELIYVPDELEDGMYLLDLQILDIEMDASPSRPLLFNLEEE